MIAMMGAGGSRPIPFAIGQLPVPGWESSDRVVCRASACGIARSVARLQRLGHVANYRVPVAPESGNPLGNATGNFESLIDVQRKVASLKTGILRNAILISANFSIIATDEKGIIQRGSVVAVFAPACDAE